MKLFITVVFAVVFAVSSISFAQETKQRSIKEVIDSKGQIVQGSNGSFDATGYHMNVGTNGEPTFTSQGIDAVNGWFPLGSGVTTLSPISGVDAIAINGNDVYVGGGFVSAGGNPDTGLAKWDGSSWSSVGNFNGYVTAIAISGNDVYVGGTFEFAGGVLANNIARWDGSNWHSLGLGVRGSGGWAQVKSIAINGNDVYVGGYFTLAGPNPAYYVAKWNGSSWSTLGTGVDDAVWGLAANGNDVYAVGFFNHAGGIIANHIAKWNGSSWTTLGTGLNEAGIGVAVSGNDVYVTGGFTTAGGINASRIAKWNGSGWSALGQGLSFTGFTLAVSGSDLYVGGLFTVAGGTHSHYISKWNGTSWSPLDSGMNDEVHSIAISGNDLYAGGFFTRAGGNPINKIARWDMLLSSVSTVSTTTPDGYELNQNYPNPFNPSTKIKFSIPQSSFVILKVYDISGREVASLVNQKLNSGTFEYEFDASGLTSGAYFYRINAGEFAETKRMILTK